MAWQWSPLFRTLRKGKSQFTNQHFMSSSRHNLPSYSIHLGAVSQLETRMYSSVSSPLTADSSPILHEKSSMTNFPENRKAETIFSSLNDSEIAKFAAIAETWWDLEGPFKPLHWMNPTRVSFIRSALCRCFRKDPYCPRPLEGLNIIDVGCGGGILSEPLARMGATVTGIDAVDKNIKIASLHASLDPLTSSIEYCCTTAGRQISSHPSKATISFGEQLVEEQRKFDAVIALEVIEHVANPAEFCKSLSALTIPNGATIISTINRSMRAYASAVVVAEYILQWLPKGTHEWSRILTPEELVLILQQASISVQEMAGIVYNPLAGKWSLSDDISVNFILFGTKKSQ